MKKYVKILVIQYILILCLSCNVFAAIRDTSISNVNGKMKINQNFNKIPTDNPIEGPIFNNEDEIKNITYSYISNYEKPNVNLKRNRDNNTQHVKWLQDMLVHCGFELNKTGIFDEETDLAVREFQTKNNLTVDGIVGNSSRNKLIELATISYIPTMYYSSFEQPLGLLSKTRTNSKEQVKWVQDMLVHCGYKLSIDGDFGRITDNAVRLFQKENGLASDGIVGQKTVQQLVNMATNAYYSLKNENTCENNNDVINRDIYGAFTSEGGYTFRDAVYHTKEGRRYRGECLEFALASAISGYVSKDTQMKSLLLDMENNISEFRSGNDTENGTLGELFNHYGLEYIRLNENNGKGGLDYVQLLRNWIMDSGHSAILYLECPECSDTCSHSSGIVGNSGTVWTKKHHWITVIGYRFNEETQKDQIMILDNSSNVVSYKNDTTGKWYDIDEFSSILINGKTYTSEVRRMFLIGK